MNASLILVRTKEAAWMIREHFDAFACQVNKLLQKLIIDFFNNIYEFCFQDSLEHNVKLTLTNVLHRHVSTAELAMIT